MGVVLVLVPLTPCLLTTGIASIDVHSRRSLSRRVSCGPPPSGRVAVLLCCTSRRITASCSKAFHHCQAPERSLEYDKHPAEYGAGMQGIKVLFSCTALPPLRLLRPYDQRNSRCASGKGSPAPHARPKEFLSYPIRPVTKARERLSRGSTKICLVAPSSTRTPVRVSLSGLIKTEK